MKGSNQVIALSRRRYLSKGIIRHAAVKLVINPTVTAGSLSDSVRR
jgi:hypothetical protein